MNEKFEKTIWATTLTLTIIWTITGNSQLEPIVQVIILLSAALNNRSKNNRTNED